MRYLYVKNGDAVEQVERVSDSGFRVSPHGPDAFISDFLSATQDAEIFLLSRGRRNVKGTFERIHAETRNGGSAPLGKLFCRIGFAFVLARRIIDIRPDRILCGSTGSQLLICWIGSRLLRIPIVHSRHNSLAISSGNPVTHFRRAVDIMLLKRVSSVIVHGPFLRKQIIDAGVDSGRIHEFEVSFPDGSIGTPSDTDQSILFVGRMQLDKGVVDLLDAAIPLLRENSRRSLIYAGSGPALETLRSRASRTDVANQVRIEGPVPHEQVLSIMRSACVVVTPTRTEFPEGRCMVVLESLVCGVPVIAPDFGPFPFAITHEHNGLLYAPDSVGSLAEALRRILDDPALARQLRAGALRTSEQLRHSPATFSQAVNLAFSQAQQRTRSADGRQDG